LPLHTATHASVEHNGKGKESDEGDTNLLTLVDTFEEQAKFDAGTTPRNHKPQ